MAGHFPRSRCAEAAARHPFSRLLQLSKSDLLQLDDEGKINY